MWKVVTTPDLITITVEPLITDTSNKERKSYSPNRLHTVPDKSLDELQLTYTSYNGQNLNSPAVSVIKDSTVLIKEGKVRPRTDHGGTQGEQRYSSTLSLSSALEDLIPIVQEVGCAPGPVWTWAENLAPTGIRSPHRPAHSKSLLLIN